VATAAGLFKSWVGDLVGSNGHLLQHGAAASADRQQNVSAEVQGNSSAAVVDSSSSTAQQPTIGAWGRADVSADLAVLLRQHYNAEALYPYDLAYSGGKPLPKVECVVTVRLET
jgi:hypothetical protein